MAVDVTRVAADLQSILKDIDQTAAFQHIFLLSDDGGIISGNADSVNFNAGVCAIKDSEIAALMKQKGPGFYRVAKEQAQSEEGQTSVAGGFRACVFSYERLVVSVRVIPAQAKRARRGIVAVSRSPEHFMWQYSRQNVINTAFDLANALD